MLDFTKPPKGPGDNYGQSPPPFPGNQGGYAQAAVTAEAAFFQKVYVWMLGGLLTTGLVGVGLSGSDAWLRLLTTSTFVYILVIAAQFGLVLAISFAAGKMSSTAVKGLFLLYAACVGMTVSLLLRVYPSGAVAKAFLSTAGIYGAMAVYGLVTKRSLQSWGSFLFMGLVGLIIASVVNIFTRSPAMDYVICWAGVLIFAGLTAFDHQKLRVIHAGGFGNSEIENKVVIQGALTLYLDFINLFLFLLRIFGRRD